uniref:Uncharacterized protein n=1 Tax=Molossus molossus TaxID=27622 RepID=A0A7J8DQH5_MOLMO|nr:hypothetical protein HJG59_009289 [Molossus molossus]
MGKFCPSHLKVPSPSETLPLTLALDQAPGCREELSTKPGCEERTAQMASVPTSFPGGAGQAAGCGEPNPIQQLHTVTFSGIVWLLLHLLASLLHSALLASLLPWEEKIVFPEKLNGSILPGLGIPARLWYHLPAFGEPLLLVMEQDPGMQAEGLRG